MAYNPVAWFEIYVQDIERAQAFYEAVLKVKLDDMPDPSGASQMCVFAMDPQGQGASGSLVRMDGVPAGGHSTVVYFSCEDCAVEAGRVAAAGGRVHKDKMAIGEHGFCALAYDTEGNLFGLHSMR